MTEPFHPGIVSFVDGETGRVVREAPVNQVPQSMRFETVRGKTVPIVRVVTWNDMECRRVLCYGPAGELLRTTEQFRQP